MEVHAHTHTERKKWTHYLWEFLMLFLAVFCGFLAENQREHLLEQQRDLLNKMNRRSEFNEELIRKYLSLIDIEEFKIREKKLQETNS